MTKVEFRLLSEDGEAITSLTLEGTAIFSPSGVAAVRAAELERVVLSCATAFLDVSKICAGKGLEPGVDLDELAHYVSQSVISRTAPDSPVRAPLIRANVRVRPASGATSGADAATGDGTDWDAIFGSRADSAKSGDIDWDSVFGKRSGGGNHAEGRA